MRNGPARTAAVLSAVVTLFLRTSVPFKATGRTALHSLFPFPFPVTARRRGGHGTSAVHETSVSAAARDYSHNEQRCAPASGSGVAPGGSRFGSSALQRMRNAVRRQRDVQSTRPSQQYAAATAERPDKDAHYSVENFQNSKKLVMRRALASTLAAAITCFEKAGQRLNN